jgi:hypothetical protein
MRQQSAMDISSPTQYLPAHADNSFSTAAQKKYVLLMLQANAQFCHYS